MVGDDQSIEAQVVSAPKINTAASSTATSSSSASIQINIANYMPPREVGRHGCVNIPAAFGQRHLIDNIQIQHPASDDPQNPPNVDYPATRDILEELHSAMPGLNMPQYGTALAHHGIQTVNDIRSAANNIYAAIGMPEGVCRILRGYAMAMALSAEKRR
jgi:hypothetical protein